MNEEQLKEAARTLLVEAKHTAQLGRKEIQPFFKFWLKDGTKKYVHVPGELMGNGAAKDLLFAGVRIIAKTAGYTAVGFVSDGWKGKLTPEGEKQSHEIFATHNVYQLEERGWATKVEVAQATLQTPKLMAFANQEYERKGGRILFTGEFTSHVVPIDQFEGRLKIFGVETVSESDAVAALALLEILERRKADA